MDTMCFNDQHTEAAMAVQGCCASELLRWLLFTYRWLVKIIPNEENERPPVANERTAARV